MSNPTKLSWLHDKRNVDGSAFDAAQFQGWELSINGSPVASVPAGWEADGMYEVPLADFAPVQSTGRYTLALRVVNKNGRASEWSAPVTFDMDFRVPTAPTGLLVG